MRQTGELKFNLIKFELCVNKWFSGRQKGANNLLQKCFIAKYCLCCLEEDKTINKIADCLGVSPYVESEQSIFQIWIPHRGKGKYRCNILLDYPTNELISLHDEMYRESSKALCK